MTDQIGDLHNLIKIIANPDLAAKILEETKAHIEAKRENDRSSAELGNLRRQLIEDREKTEKAIARLIADQSELAKAKAVHDTNVSAHNQSAAQLNRDKQEFSGQLANLVQREGGLKERDAAIQHMREHSEGLRIEYEAKLKQLRDIVG